MALRVPSAVQKALYGAFFIIVLPILLLLWARASEPMVPVRVPASLALGISVGLLGALCMILGMAALWIYGQGLPMNLAPPARHVTQGIYQLLPHPIYTGFCLLCVAAAVVPGSASGLWLVSPVVILGCAALVLGYERQDLSRRFGEAAVRAGAVLPADELRPPTSRERMKCYLFVLLPWMVLYESVVVMGVPPDAVSAYLPFEHRLPVWGWTEVVYASCYLVTALVPLLATTARALRRFAISGLLAMSVAFFLFLTVPLIAVPRPFSPRGPLGTLLVWERALDTPSAALPSFHVIWAVLAAEALAGGKALLRWAWRGWALLVTVSCITTGMHALADIAAAFLVVVLVAYAKAIWGLIRSAAERVANSGKEWRVGGVRVISHGLYGGLAGFAGVWITLLLTGPASAPAVLVAAITGLFGAAIWAQLVEGSPVLLRPFGYFGGVLGTAVGALLAPLAGSSVWLVLGALGVSAPWVQAIGRLRCLVQGCCHGRPAPNPIGISYLQPASRVCRFTEWRGVPLHPTPVYSILWDGIVGVAMLRLWMLHAALPLLGGLYLILSGLGRFVEEAYRGEPQTPVFVRLRIYQWMAIGSIVAGGLLTAVGPGTSAPAPQFELSAALPALAFGIASGFALGVDFPDSNSRFARLT